jgi:hypothetical protein
MSNGRSERRVARIVTIEVCQEGEPTLKEWTSTENVSAHGARVLMERKLQPGKQVLVVSPNDGMRSPAMIVYCQRVNGSKFAVGLELSTRAEPWARPY